MSTKISTYSEIKPRGKTAEKKFVPLVDSKGKTLEQGGNEEEIDTNWRSLDFSKRARFFWGREPLQVAFFRSPDFSSYRHLHVDGNDSPRSVAPLVLVKRGQPDTVEMSVDNQSFIEIYKATVAKIEAAEEAGVLAEGLSEPLRLAARMLR